MEFCSLASGSTGNCYLVKSKEAALLIDVGISGRKIAEGLCEKGLSPEEISAILLTHEHIDHVKSLRMLAGRTGGQVYASGGTLEAVADKIKADQRLRASCGESFTVGDMEIKPFNLSHDAAEPFGYSVLCGGRKLTVVTDTGCISEEIFAELADADLLVLEANHEVNILKMGAYPYALKRRILGDTGHLSNEAAGECLCRMLRERGREQGAPKVALAHLSKDNNTPGQAYLTIRNILNEEDFYFDKDLVLTVLERDKASDFIEV